MSNHCHSLLPYHDRLKGYQMADPTGKSTSPAEPACLPFPDGVEPGRSARDTFEGLSMLFLCVAHAPESPLASVRGGDLTGIRSRSFSSSLKASNLRRCPPRRTFQPVASRGTGPPGPRGRTPRRLSAGLAPNHPVVRGAQGEFPGRNIAIPLLPGLHLRTLHAIPVCPLSHDVES